jgi:hypothetical protein
MYCVRTRSSPPTRTLRGERFWSVSRALASKANAALVGSPRMWTLAFGRTPTHGYAATREAAMRAVAKSWRRE